MTLSIMVECCYAMSFMKTVVYAEFRKLALYAECHYAEFHYAKCHYAECHYAEFHYTKCHYAECHYAECHHAECRDPLNELQHFSVECSSGCCHATKWCCTSIEAVA